MTDTDTQQKRTHSTVALMSALDREAPAIAVGLALLVTALVPRSAVPMATLITLIACAALIAVLRVREAAMPGPGARLLLSLGGAAVALMLASTFASAHPAMSFVGVMGQRLGAAFWLAGFALLVVMIVNRRSGDPGRVVRAIAVAAGVAAVAGLLDRLGLFSVHRFSTEPAGIFENSLTMAQVLVVGFGCAVSWALVRSGRERIIASLVALLCVAGLVAADSTAAYLGVLVAALLVTVMKLVGDRGPRTALFHGTAVALVCLIIITAAVVVLGDGTRTAFEDRLNGMSNNRVNIWSSAAVQARSALGMGSGPEQFSAWVLWNTSGGGIRNTGTYDPHNVLFSWLLAAGVPGLLAALAFAAISIERLASAAIKARMRFSLLAALAAVLAWGVTVMFSWVSGMGVLFVALILGAFAGAVEKHDVTTDPRWVYGPVVGLVVLAISLVAVGGRQLSAEYTWATTTVTTPITVEAAVALAEVTGDPSLASLACQRAFDLLNTVPEEAPAVIASIEGLDPVLDRHASWHVDSAFSRYGLATARLLFSDETTDSARAAAAASVRAGLRADPASGLMPFWAAAQSQSLGWSKDAQYFATESLKYPLDVNARKMMEGIAAGASAQTTGAPTP